MRWRLLSVIFAAGIFTGILSGTKMVDAIAGSVVAMVPPEFGPYLAVITGILSMPFTFFLSNDAFYFGILPILSGSRLPLRNHRRRDGARLARGPAGAPAQSSCSFYLPAGGPGQGRVRRPPEVHAQVDRGHFADPAAGQPPDRGHPVGWQMAALCKPDAIHWVDGSKAEYDRLCNEMVDAGTFTRLNQKKWPGCFYAKSDPSDVARVEERTFICSNSKEAAPARRTTG
jgi:hypothetical protein